MSHALADALAAAIPLLSARDAEFATSLLESARSPRGLTDKQRYWAEKLIARASAPQVEPTVVQVGGIIELINRAKAKLQRPKIRLATQSGQRVVLGMAGSGSRHTGNIMVTDGGPFHGNTYFGRITPEGTVVESGAMTPEVMALLVSFAADPAGMGAMIGKMLGACCFCSRQLDTKESLAVGYGPVCADKYGLPWG